MSGTLVLRQASDEERAHDILWREIHDVNESLNRFNPASEVSELNRSGSLDDASDTFLEYLEAARRGAAVTEGLCTPTILSALVAWGYDADIHDVQSRTHVPPLTSAPCADMSSITVVGRSVRCESPLDFGSSAKAHLCDRVVAMMGATSDVLVELGGDVALNTSPRSEPFVVGLGIDGPDPLGPRIALSSGGVATSSITHRVWNMANGTAHHIIDPRSGAPVVSQWRACTVAAPSCLEANALATAAFAWNNDAPWHLAQSGYAARLIDFDEHHTGVGSWPEEALC
jgi:thiamine biosynthesis lipoprotein